MGDLFAVVRWEAFRSDRWFQVFVLLGWCSSQEAVEGVVLWGIHVCDPLRVFVGNRFDHELQL